MEADITPQPLAPVDCDRVRRQTYAQGRALPAEVFESPAP